MFKKLLLTIALIASTVGVVTPVMARDRDDYRFERRDRERHEREERRERERREKRIRERERWERKHHFSRDRGYYDRFGYWHQYR